MATRIIFDEKKMVFKNKTIFVNEKDVLGFDSEYNVYNPKTGNFVKFGFSHSTGPEFDPKTIWIYKNNGHGLELHISQDPGITKLRADNYLTAKLKN